MHNKKVLALIVLIIFAVISITYGIRTTAKGKKGKAAITGRERLASQKSPISVERRAKRSKYASWKRSPFVPSGAVSSDLVLNGIIWSKDRPKAMIGSVIVCKGDNIAENKVVDIKPDRVILNDGIKDFELKLEK